MTIQTILRYTAITTLMFLPDEISFLRVSNHWVRLQAQASQPFPKRSTQLRSQIKSEEAHLASPERKGELWLALADSYQDEFDSVLAEDAFSHALRLLRGTSAEQQYADALDGMGTLYLRTGRLKLAEAFLKSSADIYLTIQDRRKQAGVLIRYSIALWMDRRFVEAELQSTNAVKHFETEKNPEPTDMISAYLTRSRAICAQHRCGEALMDVDRAMTLARSRLPPDSLDLMAAWMVRGVVLWKSGNEEAANEAMHEALRIVRTRNNLPSSVLTRAQLEVLGQYVVFLKTTHRKKQAKEMEIEQRQVLKRQIAGCEGCIVNASTFKPNLLLP